LIAVAGVVEAKRNTVEADAVLQAEGKLPKLEDVKKYFKEKWAKLTSKEPKTEQPLDKKAARSASSAAAPLASANADCKTADDLYKLICPDPTATVSEYNKAASKKAELQTCWDKDNGATYKGKMVSHINAFVDTLAISGDEKTALKQHTANFAVIDSPLADFSAAGFGMVMLGVGEVHAAKNMGSGSYLEFGLTHENGHLCDPLVFNDGGNPPIEAILKKAFPNRAKITAMTAVGDANTREVFADTLAAFATKAFNKDQVINALRPFCGGAADPGYPATKDRLMLVARSTAYYATLCGTENGARGTADKDYVSAFP
jgi:hypothetical protein